jgi:hypothetical protein
MAVHEGAKKVVADPYHHSLGVAQSDPDLR